MSIKSRTFTKNGPLLAYTLRTIGSRGLIGGTWVVSGCGILLINVRGRVVHICWSLLSSVSTKN